MEVIVIGWDDMATLWCFWSHVSVVKTLLSWSCESLSGTWGVGRWFLLRLWREDLGGRAPVDVPTCCWYLESCFFLFFFFFVKKKGKERERKVECDIHCPLKICTKIREAVVAIGWNFSRQRAAAEVTLLCYCIAARPFPLFRARRRWTAASRPPVVKNKHKKKKQLRKITCDKQKKHSFFFACFQVWTASREVEAVSFNTVASNILTGSGRFFFPPAEPRIPSAKVSDPLPPTGGSVKAV